MAASRASRAVHQLDEYWYHLRIRDVELPGKHRLRIGAAISSNSTQAPSPDAVSTGKGFLAVLETRSTDRGLEWPREAELSEHE